MSFRSNIAATAFVKLAGPFWGKPRLATLMQAFLAEVQELEGVFRDIEEQRDLPTADATRLEVIGRLVGQSALGLSLEGHRALIRARVRTNQSTGRHDDILTVLRLLGLTGTINVRNAGIAAIVVEIPDAITDEQAFSVHYLIPDIRSAGISATVYTTEDGYAVPGVVADLVFGDTSDFVTTPGNSLYHVTTS